MDLSVGGCQPLYDKVPVLVSVFSKFSTLISYGVFTPVCSLNFLISHFPELRYTFPVLDRPHLFSTTIPVAVPVLPPVLLQI